MLGQLSQNQSADFSWVWPINNAPANASNWARVGAGGASDNVAVPSEILLSGGSSEFNRISSRSNQLRIEFSNGTGRFTETFEDDGIIKLIFNQNDFVIAELQNISSFWNANSNRYQINSDSAFTTGNRANFRNTLRTLGTSRFIRVELFYPAPPPVEAISVSAATEPGTARVQLAAPPIRVSAKTNPGTARVSVDAKNSLRVHARSEVGTARVNLAAPKLKVSAATEPATSEVALAAPTLKVSARTEPGTARVNIKGFDGLGVSARTEPGTARVQLAAPPVRVSARTESGSARVRLSAAEIRVSAKTLAGSAIVRLAAPTLKVSARTEQGTARVNLFEPKTLSVRARTEQGTARVRLRAPTLKVSAATESGTARVNVPLPPRPRNSALEIRAELQAQQGVFAVDANRVHNIANARAEKYKT